MISQKLEDLLNLSLESTPEQREKSDILNAGFCPQTQTWELIVKYNGSPEKLAALGIAAEPLLAGYAVVTVPVQQIPRLAGLEEIEYVEMPKRLFNGLYEAKRESCILQLTQDTVQERARETAQQIAKKAGAGQPEADLGLTGEGVLIAVIDSGIDYWMPDFRGPDGKTRIAWLWDQTLDRVALNRRSAENREGTEKEPGFAPPEGFLPGVEFSREQIDRALEAGGREAAFALVPSQDRSGHGSAVAAIAGGSNPDPQLRGVAFGAQFLIVKLANPQNGFPGTTELMRAVTWALKKARAMGRPLAVNLSFGNTYGPHDGSSLPARFLDSAAQYGRNVLCAGSGNEGASFGHAAGCLQGQRQVVELAVAEYERTVSIQLWKNYADLFSVTLQTPSGTRIPVLFGQGQRQRALTQETEVLIYAGEPSPYSVWQEVFFDLLPRRDFIEPGVWAILLEPVKIVSGGYRLYLPGQEVRNAQTRFLRPAAELTLTVPSTAAKILTAGAGRRGNDAYADFSGRGAAGWAGCETVPADTKPDLIAPGTDLVVPAPDGGVLRVTGTSFSAPLVTGTAALLMEWGIVQGNDPYLYGEKMKAYLRRGARPVSGETVYPNERTGYGALCAAESLPG